MTSRAALCRWSERIVSTALHSANKCQANCWLLRRSATVPRLMMARIAMLALLLALKTDRVSVELPSGGAYVGAD